LNSELVFFSEYKIGGVQSFYYNLLKFDPFLKLNKTWILERHKQDEDALPAAPFRVIDDERIISFDANENLYDRARKIANVLTNNPGAYITNFLEELVAIQNFTTKPKAVYFICHDEGYLPTAIQYSFLIDVFIAHNPFFYDELQRLLPHRKASVFYLPYGIKRAGRTRLPNSDQPLKVLFLARIHKLKGIHELPEIDKLLKARGIDVQWTVVGDGAEKDSFWNRVKDNGNFKMLTLATEEDVLEECSKHDIFILPSFKDGLPVAMLESMSAGLVPVMYQFNEGISRIITGDIGFLAKSGMKEELVKAIEILNGNRNLLEKMSDACFQKVRNEYDIEDRVIAYYELFYQHEKFRRRKKFKFIPHSGWLDLPFVPTIIKKVVRSFKSSSS
jgi:glycosyltransferase involved in cell wall biosynthesis